MEKRKRGRGGRGGRWREGRWMVATTITPSTVPRLGLGKRPLRCSADKASVTTAFSLP